MNADALLGRPAAVVLVGGLALPVHAMDMDEADVLRACYALDATPPMQSYLNCVSQEAVRLEASATDPAEVAEAATVAPRCATSHDLVRQTTALCASYVAAAPKGLLMPWAAPDFQGLARAHALIAILSKRLSVSGRPVTP